MDIYPIYTRIANYNKLVDRFITVQVRSSSSSKDSRIFALIEILNPWHPNAQIGQTIINTLSREYYRQSNTNELINFENALKRVNEKLVQITQNGETDWIGKTNAALVLIAKDQIHLTYTGKIHGYLEREDEMMSIINSKESYTYQHPLKTFSSVISGTLTPGDKIFFSTNLLFDYLNEKNLEKILKEPDFNQVTTQIANILKSRNSRNANCIFIEAGIAEQNIDEIPEVIYLDEQKFSFYLQRVKHYFRRITSGGAKGTSWMKEKLARGKTYLNEKVAPHTKKMYEKTKSFTKEKIEYSKTQIAKSIKSIPKKEKHETSAENKSEIKPSASTKLNVKHYHDTAQKLSLLGKKSLDWLKKAAKSIAQFFHHAFLPKNRAKTYAVIALIVLAVFIANIGYLQKINKNKESDTQIETQITALESQKDDATLSMLSGDNEKAKSIFNDILNKLKAYENNKEFADRINALKTDVQKQLDKIAGINRLLTNTTVAEFTDKVKKFYILGNEIFGVAEGGNQIFRSIIDPPGKAAEVAKIPSSDKNIVSSLLKGNDIYVYTSTDQIYKYNSDKLVKIENAGGSWPSAQILQTFSDNIYFLDSKNGQIFKSVPSGDQYSSATEYFEANVNDITKAVSFTIDGYIYVLKSDGGVSKYSLGSPADFNISNMPQNSKLANPKKIYTTEDITSLYILDGNRIVELDKDGKYINQYNFSDDLKNITDFSIYPKTKELYIIDSGKVYKYNL